LMTTQGRPVRQDTAPEGKTTADRAGPPRPAGTPPAGPQPCPQNPSPLAVTQRNLFPVTRTSRPDQQRNHIHARRLDNLPVAMVPAGTLTAPTRITGTDRNIPTSPLGACEDIPAETLMAARTRGSPRNVWQQADGPNRRQEGHDRRQRGVFEARGGRENVSGKEERDFRKARMVEEAWRDRGCVVVRVREAPLTPLNSADERGGGRRRPYRPR
jgi:hypothetical protein